MGERKAVANSRYGFITKGKIKSEDLLFFGSSAIVLIFIGDRIILFIIFYFVVF